MTVRCNAGGLPAPSLALFNVGLVSHLGSIVTIMMMASAGDQLLINAVLLTAVSFLVAAVIVSIQQNEM